MKKIVTLLFLACAMVIVRPLRALEAPCYGQTWNITACKAITTKPDGQIAENTFIPQDKTVRSCFLFGCDPVYCSNWRENIRSACKSEYEGAISRYFGTKPEGTIRFEGCAQRPMAKGALGWFDWAIRKIAPDSFYNVCTTISPEDESQLKNFLKKVWKSITNP